jgi:hypothetical protein
MPAVFPNRRHTPCGPVTAPGLQRADVYLPQKKRLTTR